ncbi:hypothetical protein DFH27DRAFT_574246 [Peziza echinospora]|nr:hypothetical protein DFH27DRAFT_574246 [Peziza echinospora]
MKMDPEGRRLVVSFIHQDVYSTVIFDAARLYTHVPTIRRVEQMGIARLLDEDWRFGTQFSEVGLGEPGGDRGGRRGSSSDLGGSGEEMLRPIGVVDVAVPGDEDGDEEGGGGERTTSTSNSTIDKLIDLHGLAHVQRVFVKGTMLEEYMDCVVAVRRRREKEASDTGKRNVGGPGFYEGMGVDREDGDEERDGAGCAGVRGILPWWFGGLVVFGGRAGRGVGFLWGVWRKGRRGSGWY